MRVACDRACKDDFRSDRGRIEDMGRDRRGTSKATRAVTSYVGGNTLFDRAVFAIGLDGALTRQLLSGVIASVGSSPKDVTPDELGALLPEIESRLRLLAPADQARKSVARLRDMLLRWADISAGE
jgi:hypothetical protein